MDKTEVLIIGAGPYGVGIANELFYRGINFRIFGKAFDLWFSHTQNGSSIRSDWQTSEIYCPTGRYGFLNYLKWLDVPGQDNVLDKRLEVSLYRDYLKYVLHRLPYEIEPALCFSLAPFQKGYTAKFANGVEIFAANVVVATGIGPHKFIPPNPFGSMGLPMYHSWNVNEILNLRNKHILIVGKGQSAAEAISHLNKENQITWMLRGKPVFYSEPINLPRPIFKTFRFLSGFFFYLPAKIRKMLGKKFVDVTITPDLKQALEEVPKVYGDIYETGSTENARKLMRNVDLILFATGFKYSIKSLAFLNSDLLDSLQQDNLIPRLNYFFESSAKRLYFAGGIAELSHGPAMRFMMGVPFSAKTIAKSINVRSEVASFS